MSAKRKNAAAFKPPAKSAKPSARNQKGDESADNAPLSIVVPSPARTAPQPSAAPGETPITVTVTFLNPRRIRITPTLPELEQILIREKNYRYDPSRTEFEQMFQRIGQGIETDLGFWLRVLTKLDELGIEWRNEGYPCFPEAQIATEGFSKLTPKEEWVVRELTSGFGGGGYVLVSEGFNPDRILATIVSSYPAKRVVITAPTMQRLRALKKSLNAKLRAMNIRFEYAHERNIQPQHILATHAFLDHIDPDEIEVLIVDNADKVSGPLFQRTVRKPFCPKYGFTTTLNNAKEDKAMIMEGIFGPQFTISSEG